jgi:hypothetical protein
MPRRKEWFPDLIMSSTEWVPNWRSVRAEALVKRGHDFYQSSAKRHQISKWREGQAVTDFVKYLRAIGRGAADGKRRQRLAELYHDLEVAINIPTDVYQQFEIELRLLSGQSLDFIATKMQMRFETVRAYCCYFFDVCDPVNAKLYRQQLIWNLNQNPIPADTERSWNRKEFGSYLHAVSDRTTPGHIDGLLDAFRHFGDLHDVSTKEGYRRKYFENRFFAFKRQKLHTSKVEARLGTVLSRLTRTSSYLVQDIESEVASIVAGNLMQLSKQNQDIACEDYDHVEPRKSPEIVAVSPQPSVTITNRVIRETTLATTVAEASNAA